MMYFDFFFLQQAKMYLIFCRVNSPFRFVWARILFLKKKAVGFTVITRSIPYLGVPARNKINRRYMIKSIKISTT